MAFQSNAFLNAAFLVVAGAAAVLDSSQTATASQSAELTKPAIVLELSHTATASQSAELISPADDLSSTQSAIASQVADLVTSGGGLESTHTSTANQTADLTTPADELSSTQSAVASQISDLSTTAGGLESTHTAAASQTSELDTFPQTGGETLDSVHSAESTQTCDFITAPVLYLLHSGEAVQLAELSAGAGIGTNPDDYLPPVTDYPRDRVIAATKRQLTIYRNMQNITAKTAAEIIPIMFDFSALCDTVSNIDAVTVINPKDALDVSLVYSGATANNATVTMNLSGGTVKQSYVISCLVSSGTAKYQLAGRIHINDF